MFLLQSPMFRREARGQRLGWWPEPEALLNMNDPSNYPVPLFDIGQPHHLAHVDGLKRDPLPFSHNPGLGCHLGP